MGKIGIITYNFEHLKTEQVVTKLVDMGYNLVIYALPFHHRKNRAVVFNHRPKQSLGMHTRILALKYNIPYIICKSDQDIESGCDIYLLTGAGILSRECVRDKIILNCHPGIIPLERGLDAFKWGIYDFNPIGNTLYIVSQDVDLGKIIKIQQTPLYYEDTIIDFANRHYSKEIDMLVNFQKCLYEENEINVDISLSNGLNIVHKRMPEQLERQMLLRFEQYKEKYAERGE